MTLDGRHRQITYIMTYIGPDQPLLMYSNRLDWHNPNFQKSCFCQIQAVTIQEQSLFHIIKV